MRSLLLVFLLLLASNGAIGAARSREPPSVSFGMFGGNASLSVTEGEEFIVTLSDFSSTGFVWYLDSVVPSSLASYRGNVTGGGVTSPPFLNVSFVAGDASDDGTVTLVHAKPWERTDPTAQKGYARVHLDVSG